MLAALAALLLAPPSAQAADKSTMLVLGDSLSSGYGLAAGESWVELLAPDFAARQRPVCLINDSISGDTTAGGAARLGASLQRLRPDWALIALGGNDGLRGGSLIAMRQNLAHMVSIARRHGVRPALLGMQLPPNYGAAYTAAFAAVYAQVAAAAEVPLLPFFLAGLETDRALFQADQIHPNAAGQAQMAANVRPFLTALLDK